ncbi:leucine-rich PPR motif-containing protein, mitochondrial-like isoform X2 [Argiope bruennichi]|uniref:leucine-rich PPR motif-containing protein, mitochondrial-like isoform X2 n=1 Tax=Argiope bruennichi TaxID=94029 RepID=UPI00249548AA|nr:leucine-rich PPR motif-containing protein, mitochondrial-like isoform X2 [Argiope bruennichi]
MGESIMNRTFHRCFVTAALPQHYEIKDNFEEVSLDNVTLQDVDKAFVEMDYAVKRTGRCSKINVKNILSLIEKLHSFSEVHGLYLLRCCGLMYMEKPAERVQLANEIWEKLHKLDVHLDVKHYNSLLKVFVDCDHQFLTSEFLASMESSKIEPNKATYLLLLQKYCNDGNLSGAGEILQCLKEKGLPINESVFTILIKGHMRANDVSGAKDILEVMRSANLSPTAESYATLSCGFAERGDIDGLNSVLAEAKDNNIVLSNKHYLDIISSWSNAENMKIVDEMLENIVDVNDWRQEIINAMLGLVYKGMDASAFKLLLRIANPENNFTNVFLKALLKCDTPKEKIISYCEEISDRRLHNYIFMNATKAAIDFGKFELALTLFEALQKKGVPVRTYNLHLLLSSFKDQEEGIWLTLKKMFELGVPAEFFTYFEYVFPSVSVSNPDAVISKIQETGHSFTAAIDPLFQFYCYHGEFDNALYLIEKYPVSVHPSFSLENYLNICKNIKNYSKACLKVLNHLLQNVGVPAQDPEVAAGVNLASLIQKDRSLFEALLRIPDEQIQLSKKSLDICSTVLRRNNPDSLKYLRRLKYFRNHPSEKKISSSITEEKEELKLLKEKGLSAQRYLLECLSSHLKERNITRINQLTEELDKQGAQYPPTVLAQLLSFYCQNNDLEKAEKYFKVLKNDCPTFNIDSLKVIDYATLLIKYSKLDDAVNAIKMECQELHLFGYADAAFRKGVRNLLNIAIETGNSDLVKSLQDSFSFHAETLQANVLYEPLIKMHLYKNDLDSAINEFEKCVKNHRVAPCLKLLMKKCIVTENPTKLQIVIKTASTLSRKQVVLYDLVIALLETGRRSEAKKIMGNLKDKSYSSYLEDICTQMYNQNRVCDILELVNLLWLVDHIDREKIVQYIFKLSSERNDLKTAQDLYNFISKSFKLNDEIIEIFSNLLSKNRQQAPFTVSKSDVSDFLQCLQVKDAHLALKNLQRMKKGIVRTLGFNDMTNCLDLLLKNKLLNDFSQNVNAMSYVIENANEILKPLLEKYSSCGDIDSLVEIANFFPDFALKKCSFNNYLSKGYISSEKHEDLLFELEKCCDKRNKLFSVFAFEELLKRPDLEERVINLAKKYLKSNFDMPIAVVWAHYLIQGRYEEAEALYKLHSVPADKIDTLVLRTVRQQENVILGKAYISVINSIDAPKRCKERTYGTVLDVLVLKEMYDDAAGLVAEAQAKDIDLEKHYQSTLITLKNALEREKKKVQFFTPIEGHVISE